MTESHTRVVKTIEGRGMVQAGGKKGTLITLDSTTCDSTDSDVSSARC